MRMSIANNIKLALLKINNAKKFIKFVEERSQTIDKSFIGILMSSLTVMKFDSSRIMHEHVIDVMNIATRLKYLRIIGSKSFFVQFILNLLSSKYGPFQDEL